MIIIETERLILRTWDIEDVASGLAIWGDKEVMASVLEAKVLSDLEIKEKIKRGIDHQMRYGYQHWAVVLKSTGQVIGDCGFNTYYDDESLKTGTRMIELSFHLAKSFWGKGYATESAKACIDYAGEKDLADVVIAGVNKDNIRSTKILEKLGFEYKGLVYFEALDSFEPMFEYHFD